MFSQWLLKQVTSESCAHLLREYRWKDGVQCPHCHASQVGRMHDQHYQEVYRYRCAVCRKSFTDLTGTIFEYSQATLPEWFLCIHLVSLKCSTLQISEELGISYDLADSMVKTLGQRFFDSPCAEKLLGHVEIDELYQNAGEKGVEQTEREPCCRANDRRGRGTMDTDRPPIMGFIQRDGILRLVVTDNVQKKLLSL